MRSVLGKLLFSGDDAAKPVRVLSGGERGRMLFGKLMLQRPNVLLMDEPTNHMDMESIESLNLALEQYTGTLIFVSHDRQFVSVAGDADHRARAGGGRPLPGQLRRLPAPRGASSRTNRVSASRAAQAPPIALALASNLGHTIPTNMPMVLRAIVYDRAGRFLCDNVNGVL